VLRGTLLSLASKSFNFQITRVRLAKNQRFAKQNHRFANLRFEPNSIMTPSRLGRGCGRPRANCP
jgi:hypothetical protein